MSTADRPPLAGKDLRWGGQAGRSWRGAGQRTPPSLWNVKYRGREAGDPQHVLAPSVCRERRAPECVSGDLCELGRVANEGPRVQAAGSDFLLELMGSEGTFLRDEVRFVL